MKQYSPLVRMSHLGCLCALICAIAASAQTEQGFRALFNGKDLTGWDGLPQFWSVRDGAITGQTTKDNPTKGNTFLIWTGGEVADFELRLSYKITANNEKGFANSGIQYRSKRADANSFVVGGYQADFEAGKSYSGILYEERGRGILAERGQKVVIKPDPNDANKHKIEVAGSLGNSADIQARIKADDWNDYVIVAKGNHLQHFINGVQTIDVVDEHATKAAKSGILALQLHAGEPMTVQFKNVRVRSLSGQASAAAGKKILLIAGKQSHGPGDHEFRAGCLLLKKCLDGIPGVTVEVHTDGWPASDSAFEGADAVVIYCDGGGNHPAIQGGRIQIMDELASKGVGIGCMHYAVEVPKGEPGAAMQRWIGGYYEHLYSVNPMWVPHFRSESFRSHPVTRGVGSFALLDEWYFNMRWPLESNSDGSMDGALRSHPAGVTPILAAVASDMVRRGPYVHPRAPYDHIIAASGRTETMMWTFDRPDGGRSFGFTGGHKHVNWANDNGRKVVLNAILWIAKAEVPPNGVESTVTPEELSANLDPKGQTPDAPNLTGSWTCHVETENGSGEPKFSFVHAGQNLLGTYAGLLGEAVVFGSVSKTDDVKFWFTATPQGEELAVNYSGKIEPDGTMKGKVRFGELGEGTWTGKR